MPYAIHLCGLNAVTTQNKTINKSPMMVVAATCLLTIIYSHYLTLIEHFSCCVYYICFIRWLYYFIPSHHLIFIKLLLMLLTKSLFCSFST